MSTTVAVRPPELESRRRGADAGEQQRYQAAISGMLFLASAVIPLADPPVS